MALFIFFVLILSLFIILNSFERNASGYKHHLRLRRYCGLTREKLLEPLKSADAGDH